MSKYELKESVTLDAAIEFLNELVGIDPEAVTLLLEERVVCNREMLEHPSVQCVGTGHYDQDGQEEVAVGILGVLNGLFGVKSNGWGAIAAQFDDDGYGGYVLSKFVKDLSTTSPVTETQEVEVYEEDEFQYDDNQGKVFNVLEVIVYNDQDEMGEMYMSALRTLGHTPRLVKWDKSEELALPAMKVRELTPDGTGLRVRTVGGFDNVEALMRDVELEKTGRDTILEHMRELSERRKK